MRLGGLPRREWKQIFKNCDAVEGRQRGAHAELVVVPDLAFSHDEERPAGDAESTETLLYIVALGRDVATLAQLTRASGVPKRPCVPSGWCGTTHAPLKRRRRSSASGRRSTKP